MPSFDDLRANDPCLCGSGKRYKECHKTLHRASDRNYLAVAQKFYLDRWLVNASTHSAAGDYDWMIDQLPATPKRILDIGVGEGVGVETMLRRLAPDKVVALEENLLCARRARLRLAGLDTVEIDERAAVVPAKNGGRGYSLAFKPGSIGSNSRVSIVMTDPLFDPTLAEDLIVGGQFDLVTVWLMGSHEAREYCEQVEALGVGSAAEYRLYVQNAVYELADKVLAVGGHLQIVDRVQHPDLAAIKAELERSHTEQAEPTTLKVENVTFRPHREAAGGRVTLLRETPGQVTLTDGATPMHLVSIVSVKA